MTVRRRIVVVNRVHTDEVNVGDAVDEFFAQNPPIDGVTFVTREIPKAARSKRGVVENVITKFPGSRSGNADEQFAYRVTQAAKDADLVWDMHETKFDDSSYGFCGERANRLTLGVASLLSTRIVHCPKPHAASLLSNYVGWDVSTREVGRIQELGEFLIELVQGWTPPLKKLQHFRHTGQVVSVDDAQRLGLARYYREFERLPDSVAELGFSLPAHALAWDADKMGHLGWYGEIVTPY